MKLAKGANCSKEGSKYEKEVHKIVSKIQLYNGITGKYQHFNTQKVSELGGSSASNDLVCNYNGIKNVGIEIKKGNVPDWVQCSLKCHEGKWVPSSNGKIPHECRTLFQALLNDIVLFEGGVPPFMDHDMTHEEWLETKQNTHQWNDLYSPIPEDTIAKMYKAKGCNYIQIKDYGMYHLGSDVNVCGFDVPYFSVKQYIRIRTKVHSRKNKKGFASLSVTASCIPVTLKDLEPSLYSLDSNETLPPQFCV